MKKYNDFIFNLKEGLIRTYDITTYQSNIVDYLKQMDIKHNLNIIDKLEFKLSLFNVDENFIDIITYKCYVLGYFPSYYWITKNKMENGFKDLINLDLYEKIEIKFEAKYDDGLYTNDIICPDKLYHLTYQNLKENIFKKGLYPKSKNRISVHPERIYLFDDIDNYDKLLKSLKCSDFKNNIDKKYILIEINCTTKKLILHTDPNYRLGYFTYDNINPKNIYILKENL